MGFISDEFEKSFRDDGKVAQERQMQKEQKANGVSKQFNNGIETMVQESVRAEMTAVAMAEYSQKKKVEAEEAKKGAMSEKKAKEAVAHQESSERASASKDQFEDSVEDTMASDVESESVDDITDERARNQAYQEALCDDKFGHIIEADGNQGAQYQLGE